jgi:pantoate--beta-alanine ligase
LKIAKTKTELFHYLHPQRESNVKIGLVPTMGALHDGHISLVNRSKNECDFTVVSIFVNPTQFNNPVDLLKYPKPIEQDILMLEDAGCHLLFNPDVDEIYSPMEVWDYEVGALDSLLEGEFRPGHYQGVTQIVFKLFDLIKPHFAFFGQKDYQQFLVIQKMNQDLNLGIKLAACPIIRDADGLAMSSRNIRLNAEERKAALVIYQSLTFIKDNFKKYDLPQLLEKSKEFYHHELLNLEYFKICNSHNLQQVREKNKEVCVALVACFVGETRLIDNMILS